MCTWHPSIITVPAWNEAIEDGRLQGATFSCFVSEKGDYVGDGTPWLLPGDEGPFSISIFGHPANAAPTAGADRCRH